MRIKIFIKYGADKFFLKTTLLKYLEDFFAGCFPRRLSEFINTK